VVRAAESIDLYGVLGVAASASAAEIRRAYRHLALRFHPDRAGPAGTARFRQIADAYRVLSDGVARAAYDAGRSAGSARPPATGKSGPGAPGDPDNAGPYRERRHVTFGGSGTGPHVIDRLSGPLEQLIASAAARRHADGSLDLLLNASEIQRGGTAAITLPCRIACRTCGGVAQKNLLWCTRCEFEGTIVEEVTVCVPIPPHVADGTGFRVTVDPIGDAPSLRLRIKHDRQRG
jgi:DnaJ-class molecular chaperone